MNWLYYLLVRNLEPGERSEVDAMLRDLRDETPVADREDDAPSWWRGDAEAAASSQAASRLVG